MLLRYQCTFVRLVEYINMYIHVKHVLELVIYKQFYNGLTTFNKQFI